MQPARGRFARFDLDRQIASTFPAHWKVGPAPVFWASRPLEPAEWLALLILKAGDVESSSAMLSAIKTMSSAYNISSNMPSFISFVTSTAMENNNGDKTDP